MEHYVRFLYLFSTFIIWDRKVASCDVRILVMWKVENSELSIIPRSRHKDQFLPQSSLVIWKGSLADENHYLYYWLGQDVSTSVAATTAGLAMKKAFEKCHKSISHREIQGHESNIFKSYFGGAFGPIDFRFKEKKLFYLRGDAQVRIKQVELDPEWLKKGGCLVLHSKKIFIHCGVTANQDEIAVAKHLAKKLSEESHEETKISAFVVGGTGVTIRTTKRRVLSFAKEIGTRSTYNTVGTAACHHNEEDFEEIRDKELSLTMVFHDTQDTDSPSVKIEKINYAPFEKKDLHSLICLVLDSVSEAGIFIWIGKDSSSSLREAAAEFAEKLLNDNNYPLETPITTVEQGAEPLIFLINFVDGLPPQE